MSPATAFVPDRLTTTAVPSDASSELIPPEPFSATVGAVGAEGATVSTVCTDWAAAALELPAPSTAADAATSTVRSPSKLAVGVTTSV